MGNLNRPKFQRFWFPVILYSGIIFWVSSIPNIRTPLPGVRLDVFFHVLMYIPFGFLLARAVHSTGVVIPKGALLGTVVLLSFLYGASDEIHQLFVQGRSAQVIDLIADTIGGMAGGCIFLLFFEHRRR